MDQKVARALADLMSVEASVTSNGKILYANPAFRRRALETPGWKDPKGQRIWDLYQGEDSDQVHEWYKELLSRDDSFGVLELRIRSEDTPPETETLFALRLEGRELIVIRPPDAWPLMESIDELERTAHMFRSYLRDGVLGLMILQDDGDREAVIRFINPEGAAILEREPQDLLDLEVAGFIVPEERQEALSMYMARTEGKRVDPTQDVRFLTPSEETVLLHAVLGMTTWRDEPAVYCIFSDETAKRIMLEELRRFAQGFEMLEDTMVLADRNLNVLYINPAGLRRSGYAFEEVIGKNAYIFGTTKEGEAGPQEVAQELFIKGIWKGERTAISKEGREYPVDVSVTLAKDLDGAPDMVAVLSRDISDRKADEQAILRARERAEFFTDLMSHDINNYIQGVIGFLDLLSQDDLDASSGENLEKAKEQATRVSRLIERVRSLSKVQHSGDLEPVELCTVLREVIADVRDRYVDREVEVLVDGPDTAVQVMADELLRDLILNLVDNAIKHGGEEPITVEVSVLPPRIAGDRVTITVADHGPGIPDEDKSSVFYRYVRRGEDSPGTGLGLSLVMALTDRYGGRVWIEDRVPGQHQGGARVVLELSPAPGTEAGG